MSEARLTEKQKRFIDNYIITGNATESAILAGYSKKTAAQIGSENLIKLDKFLAERHAEIASKRIANGTEVMEFFSSVMRGELTEQVPIFIDKGVQKLTDKDASIRDRLEAAKQLAKRHGIDHTDEASATSDVVADWIKGITSG